MSKDDEHKFEIGHVLFMDIVGYSKLVIDKQTELTGKLNEIVRSSDEFRRAESERTLVRLPTGDGVALVFRSSPEAPVQCAREVATALQTHPEIKLRMGIHSGPVKETVDVNDRLNIAGAGINMAQRVMDCGDAGHILLSKRVADDLENYQRWQPHLHDLGDAEVKHGVQLRLVNFYGNEFGNPATPAKLRQSERRSTSHAKGTRDRLVIAGLVLLAALAGITWWMRSHSIAKSQTALVAPTPEKSIAVLPFENLSTKEENAVFAGGVHREILLNLAKIKDLRVISRTSVMQYKVGTTRNLKEIARELGVSHVVEGSVQREGDSVRVTTELIDAKTDTPVWAEAYDRKLADVFAIQSEIAQKITAELGAHLSEKERTALANAPTHDVEAFDLYTKAQVLMDTSPDDLAYAENFTKAVQLLEPAVRRDPQFTLAYCALAEANTQLYRDGRVTNCAPAEAALKEARRIAPDAGETHFAEALIYYYCDHDFNRALATLELAARSLPNDNDVFNLRGLLERRLGRWKESLRHFTQAIEVNPKDPYGYGQAWGVALALRQYAESHRILDAAIAAFPADADSWHAAKGFLAVVADTDTEAARQQLRQIGNMHSKDSLELAFYVPFVERNYAEAEKALAGFVNEKLHRIDSAEFETSFAVATNRVGEKHELWSAVLKDAAERIARKDLDSYIGLKASALINAALGNKQDAIDTAKRAVELFPITQDALIGPVMLNTLALVYTWTDEEDLAFEILFKLAKTPHGGIHAGDLKLNPDWDKLRDDPRFSELMTEATEPLN